MALTKSVSYTGQQSVSTLRGSIRLEEGRGRLVVYDPITGETRNVQDIDGTHIYDSSGNERTRLDTLGLTTIRAAGTYANRVGQAESDERDGIWTSEPGVDLRDLGI